MKRVVAYLLPGHPKPIGGFKFIYRLAKEQSHLYNIRVIHVPSDNGLIGIFRFILSVFRNKFKDYAHEEFGIRVEYSIGIKNIMQKSDRVYICSWQLMLEYKTAIISNQDKCIHFVMDFPGFMGPEDKVLGAWDLNIRYYAISSYLQRYFIEKKKNDCALFGCIIPNHFPIDNNTKIPRTVLMNYSSGAYKNSKTTLVIAEMLAKKGFKVTLFGRESVGSISHHNLTWKVGLTDLEVSRLYMNSEFFISLSSFEGFGIPSLEALLYGCLLITSDNFGNRDYLIDGAMSILPSGYHVTDVFKELDNLLSCSLIDRQWRISKGKTLAEGYLSLSDVQLQLLTV